MRPNNALITIAIKEYADALKNSLFLTLLGFLLALVGISLLVSAFNFQNQVAQYKIAMDQLQHSGLAGAVLSPPQYYPLQSLRGTVEYLEIIGAVIGIILGYLAFAKEKGSNTMRLLLSRPIGKTALVGGKILGGSALILSVLAIMFLFIIIAISGIGRVGLSQDEIVKLGLAFFFSYLYLTFFFCFSMILTANLRSVTHALMLAFTVWLVLVLIIPQIGDTMDPDNQVPGGFFNSMAMSSQQQRQVISKFKTYENLRNALEVTSLEKRYERLVFAALGIKDIYNGKSLAVIFRDKWSDAFWLFSFYILSVIGAFALFTNKKMLAAPP